MNETKLVPEAVQKIHSNEFNHMAYSCSEELRQNWFEIEVGPEYKIKTNLGELLTIHLLYLNGGGSQPYSHLPCFRKFFFYAYNESQDLVAQRVSMLFRDLDFLMAQGRIDVLRRGEGIALPLERVHFDILQRQANITETPLAYQVQNSNKEELDNTRELYRGQINGDTVIAQKEDEYRRWRRLYAPSGKLGLDANLCKTFYPDFNNNDPFPIRASIVLGREQSSDSKIGQGVTESVRLLSDEEWKNYEKFANDRVFTDFTRLSESVGKKY